MSKIRQLRHASRLPVLHIIDLSYRARGWHPMQIYSSAYTRMWMVRRSMILLLTIHVHELFQRRCFGVIPNSTRPPTLGGILVNISVSLLFSKVPWSRFRAFLFSYLIPLQRGLRSPDTPVVRKSNLTPQIWIQINIHLLQKFQTPLIFQNFQNICNLFEIYAVCAV